MLIITVNISSNLFAAGNKHVALAATYHRHEEKRSVNAFSVFGRWSIHHLLPWFSLLLKVWGRCCATFCKCLPQCWVRRDSILCSHELASMVTEFGLFRSQQGHHHPDHSIMHLWICSMLRVSCWICDCTCNRLFSGLCDCCFFSWHLCIPIHYPFLVILKLLLL